MFVAYVSAGLPTKRFWNLSPRLYLLEMRGASAKLDREHRDRAWLAYHTAYLPDAKRRPRLDELIGGKVKHQPKPWQDQLAAWQRYAAYKEGAK
jgi:hypothetical protein